MLEINKIYNDDCMNLFKQIDDNSIDCFFSDIPYKITKGGCSKNNKYGTKVKFLKQQDTEKVKVLKEGKIFTENDISPKQYLPEIYRVMKNMAHGYIMVNSNNLKDVMIDIENTGFIINNILVMKKNNCVVNKWYMKDIEFTIFFRKGNAKPLNNCGIKSCLDVVMPKNKIHDTQKPIEYVQTLIENSTKEGDIVLDCFSGSGTTAIACKNIKRNFICIEKDKNFYEASLKRLNNNYTQIDLF